jgi:glycosyltransferase involved in cell wall biosynthesis
VRIAAIIPTRNRPRFALNAVRSLLDQDSRIDVYLSDNSSTPDVLREYCDTEPRVTYLRPDRELPLGKHWDWAVREAMTRSTATHFTVHYDRKLSKPGSWDRLARLAEAWPDEVITFTVDSITGDPPPLRIWQPAWTGKLFSIETAPIAAAIATGTSKPLARAFPILSNCLTPRSVLDSVVDRFGDVCNAIGPDASFLARFLALRDRVFHHDRPQGILYGSSRSNGGGYLRGKGGDYHDFVKLADKDSWLEAAPIPGIDLGYNMLYHDYELVRRQIGDRLPPLIREAVIRDLAEDLHWKADRRKRQALRDLLVEQGWNGPEPAGIPSRTLGQALRELYLRYRMRKEGETPETVSGFVLRNEEEGISLALRYPRLRQERNEELEALGFTEVAA